MAAKVTQKYTAETIMCEPLDTNKLDAAIDAHFHKSPNGKPEVTYHTIWTMAIIRQPKRAIISDEFVGSDIGDTITFNVYEEIRSPDGKITGHVFPDWEIKLSLAELAEYLMPAVTLAEFTKQRRGYNSRIIGNESAWMRHFNK